MNTILLNKGWFKNVALHDFNILISYIYIFLTTLNVIFEYIKLTLCTKKVE